MTGLFSKKAVRNEEAAGGSYVISPLTIEQIDHISEILPKLVEAIADHVVVFHNSIVNKKPDFAVLGEVIIKDIKLFRQFVHISTGIDHDTIGGWTYEEFMNVIASIYEVNTDFFTRKSSKAWIRMVQAMTNQKLK